MVTFYSHTLVLFRCSKTCMVWNKTNLPVFFFNFILLEYLFARVKMKQCLLGISRLDPVGWLSAGCWKLTEIKLAQKSIEVSRDTRDEQRKKERNLREHCWLTVKNAANRLFVKSSAASASTSANTANTANTASTNVSNTGEPTHLEKDSTERNMSRRMKRQTWITAWR